jgi:mannose-1-phosphate guanylyltransferase
MSEGKKLPAHAIILAGGRGTRFWPRSRAKTPKQLLNIVGRETMLVQTVKRVRPLFPASRIWVVTNAEQAAAVRRQLPNVSASRILAEPLGRNTAAAIGIAAVHLLHQSKDALMAVLPADHFIAEAEGFRKIVAAALEVASQGRYLVVLGIPPARAETGYGYIERADATPAVFGCPVFRVRRFTEKPDLSTANEYLASGRYYWNAGMFFWRASAFVEKLRRFLPATHDALMRLAETLGTRRYAATLKKLYPKLENISVDYAIMERATLPGEPPSVFVLPADVGWSDIGSWAAVYDLQARRAGENVSAGPHWTLDAAGNFFWSPEKFVTAIGVQDLVVVETPDALLICPRDRAQDVGKIVKWLEDNKKSKLL